MFTQEKVKEVFASQK